MAVLSKLATELPKHRTPDGSGVTAGMPGVRDYLVLALMRAVQRHTDTDTAHTHTRLFLDVAATRMRSSMTDGQPPLLSCLVPHCRPQTMLALRTALGARPPEVSTPLNQHRALTTLPHTNNHSS
jgi:hypothetical protein